MHQEYEPDSSGLATRQDSATRRKALRLVLACRVAKGIGMWGHEHAGCDLYEQVLSS